MKSHSARMLRTLILALVAFATAAHAQSGTSLAGRVTDAFSGLPLQGTRVAIEGIGESYTDRTGHYLLSGLPEGEYTVTFSYVGYSDISRQVTLTAGNPTTLGVSFGGEGDTVNLDEVVITGTIAGTARAINQQRAADTLTNVVASDAIGRFPDENAAEALQRIPGLALYRDQGEGRYIVMRGINYALNSVTLNGAKLASPEEGDRGIALDVLPSDALASIEVFKVPTPEMDGEGVGGVVNIKTKSPFDFDGVAATAKVQGIYSALSGKLGYKYNGLFSTVSSDGKLGFLVAPTWQVRKFGSYNYENDGWSEEESPTDGNDYYMLEAVNFRDYVIERKRYGVSASLEGHPTNALSWYVRGNYDRFKDTEQRYRTVIDFTEGDLVSLDGTSAQFENVRRYRRDLRDRVKDQDIQALLAGFESRVANWSVDGKVGYSKGHEENPDETQYRFRHNDRDGVFRYDFADPYDLKVTQLGGADITDPSSYELQRAEVQNDSGDEDEIDLMFNARWDLPTDRPAYAKFGAAYRAKKKTSVAEVVEYSDGPADFTFANLVGQVSDYPYYHVPRLDVAEVRAAFWPNLSQFEGERQFEDSELDDWVSHEDVLAAYGMGSMKFGATTLTAGVRVERTKFDSTGKNVDLANEVVLGDDRSSRTYTNWLPGVYLRHDFSKNTVLRASYSNSLSRPSFGDSASRLSINDDDEEVFMGNPNLEALESTNLDASIESYLPSLGVVSAAVFYKQIDNFSYEIEIDGGYAPLPDYELTTYQNGSDGTITGLELAYQQQLRMLAEPFDGLGVLVNATFSHSSAEYPTRPGEKLDFIGNSDRVANFALTYEKGGFFARLALNYRSERLREDEPVGGDKYEDIWVDAATQLDLTTSYRFNEQWEIFGEWVNITNEPFRVFFKSPAGQPERLGQFEEYDWSANFGVRWRM